MQTHVESDATVFFGVLCAEKDATFTMEFEMRKYDRWSPSRWMRALRLLALASLATSLTACKYPDEGAGKNGPIKKWGVSVNERVQSTPAVAADGTVYVGSSDQHMYAFSPSGKLRWKRKVEGHALSPAIAPDGAIVFTSAKGDLNVVEPDGSLRWSKNVRQKVAGCPPAISKEGYAFTSGDLILIGYHLKDQKKVFSMGKKVKLPLVMSCPVIDAKDILYFSNKKKLYAWSLKTKSKLWEYPISTPITPPAFDKMGNVYFGRFDKGITVLSSQGKKLWSYQAAPVKHLTKRDLPAYFGIPAVAPNGDVIVTRNHEGVYAISAKGKKRWLYRQDLAAFSRHVLIAKDGMVYVGAQDNHFYAITAKGKLHYRFQTDRRVLFGAAFSPDQSVVYFGSFDKHLYALHTHKKSP